ncbi:HotDog domain-containing protein [Mycena epipterygia]|nr:HotDog domain-containing protein [Mycena epipterygia]
MTLGFVGLRTAHELPPPQELNILFVSLCPRRRPSYTPRGPSSKKSQAHSEVLEADLQALPMLKALRARADADDWYETRPHRSLSMKEQATSFTGGVLRGPGKLTLYPLVRARKDERIFVHLGRALCAYHGIVHGGVLATLLDEALARNGCMHLPAKVGVTAMLSLDYRAPTRADQFVVLKTQMLEINSRMATVAGCVEDLEGTILVEAKAVFIQPRNVDWLDLTLIWKQLGEPVK